jgi:hypothetical protein
MKTHTLSYIFLNFSILSYIFLNIHLYRAFGSNCRILFLQCRSHSRSNSNFTWRNLFKSVSTSNEYQKPLRKGDYKRVFLLQLNNICRKSALWISSHGFLNFLNCVCRVSTEHCRISSSQARLKCTYFTAQFLPYLCNFRAILTWGNPSP